MATLEQVQTHIKKAQSVFDGSAKKADDPKDNPEVRQKKKKLKRLQRKASKMVATAQMVEEKKKPKKERKKAAEG